MLTWSAAISTTAALQVVGWDAVAPLAVPDQGLAAQNGVLGPLGFGHVARLDSAGNPGPYLGGADCMAGSGLPDGTVVCVGVKVANQYAAQVRRANGTLVFSTTAGDCERDVVISPDAGHIACNRIVVGADGRAVPLPTGFQAEGWLDDATVIGNLPSGSEYPGDTAYVRLATPGRAVDLGFVGTFAGVVQAGTGTGAAAG